ncbi:PEPxxWA-CTERM sorting domain-containing protein [Phenylobacterium sp.]|uniref:PEPxxWA-CTERM sorting domain-containing protein n=1 Tax=Phenylobacterium sp. TaxID=1871053 RepID=UPI0025D97614|nr:PEPxxWA-CTERM sorting domain-containing protein [Phenylobacterium sp.]MBX3484699.1 PEP-CTERM sorting domain-containing protein [Phenylobacterium sp.]
MKGDLFQRLGAITAAGAVLLAAGAAQADVYDLNLNGVVSAGSTGTSGDTQFYTLDLLAGDDFAPFELQVGDVFNLTVTLDTFLDVPASDITFFGVDLLTSGQFGFPPGFGFISTGSVQPLDGSLAGETYGSACSNCAAGSAILSPGPAFSFSQLFVGITIENLTPFDPGDTSPFELQGFVLRYQATTNPVTGVVPEPATWAMMIGGFGLAGAVLRRRRLVPA